MGGSSSKKISPPKPAFPPAAPIPAFPPAAPRPAVPPAAPKPAAPLAPPKPAAPLAPPKPAAPPEQNVIIRTANPIPVHDANNYIIPKIDLANQSVPKTIIHRHGEKFDRFYMKICSKYQSQRGCNAQHCYRFHVCSYWIRDNCSKKDCRLNHDFMGQHNLTLLKPLITTRFGEHDMKEKLKKYMYSGKAIREELADCICIEYILKKCQRSNCEAQHFDSPYVWQVYLDSKWEPIHGTLNKEIEQKFANPQNNRIELKPQLNRPAHQNRNQGTQLFDGKTIKIDFERMSLMCDNKIYRIKRLSTPSDVASFSSLSTRWLWYWEDDPGNWQFYTNAVVDRFFIIPFSDYIETQFLKKEREFVFSVPNHPYQLSLNLENMIQANKVTGNVRSIRRRPMNILETPKWKDNTTFMSLWSNSISTQKYQRQTISSNSCEYQFVRQMIEKSLPTCGMQIERVENQHLWQAYQLKKAQMLNANSGPLNEQYLFHGTSESVLDKICAENLDWRLYGTNVGNVFGRGTYFALNASLSEGYAQRNEGYKYMFVVLVLVGTAVVGNSSMTLPPICPITKKRFDTTVNSETPTILVKYNLDEYYPVYLVKL